MAGNSCYCCKEESNRFSAESPSCKVISSHFQGPLSTSQERESSVQDPQDQIAFPVQLINYAQGFEDTPDSQSVETINLKLEQNVVSQLKSREAGNGSNTQEDPFNDSHTDTQDIEDQEDSFTIEVVTDIDEDVLCQISTVETNNFKDLHIIQKQNNLQSEHKSNKCNDMQDIQDQDNSHSVEADNCSNSSSILHQLDSTDLSELCCQSISEMSQSDNSSDIEQDDQEFELKHSKCLLPIHRQETDFDLDC
ncbi:hypothetical protein RRG08_001458 [Elysia crispata]|uniref:Uncharacterized protein n=1 Tax=Elysia crispata TaxID=231223 RepID=A0AAE1DK93_9GAST|nr:hypothetical protein RRG08_001458 [Elysia crispata]